MRWSNEIDCPICDERDAVTIWERKCDGNKKHYFFKCDKCKREWH